MLRRCSLLVLKRDIKRRGIKHSLYPGHFVVVGSTGKQNLFSLQEHLLLLSKIKKTPVCQSRAHTLWGEPNRQQLSALFVFVWFVALKEIIPSKICFQSCFVGLKRVLFKLLCVYVWIMEQSHRRWMELSHWQGLGIE